MGRGRQRTLHRYVVIVMMLNGSRFNRKSCFALILLFCLLLLVVQFTQLVWQSKFENEHLISARIDDGDAHHKGEESDKQKQNGRQFLIMIWNHFGDGERNLPMEFHSRDIDCKDPTLDCRFTKHRQFANISDAIVFKGSG